jgi:23S rRNA (uracil1939-C5)-methyltransferase
MHGVPLPPEGIYPILGVENPEYYRNKMVFTFGRDPTGETVLGLHRRNNWREIIPAEICRLASPESNEIQRRTLAFIKANGIEPFDDITKTGVVRTLMVREGKATGQRMVVLGCIEFTDTVTGLADVLGELVDTVLVGADRRVEGPPIPVEYRLLKGVGIIEERLNDLVFEIGPDTFFQTNTLQASHLFRALVTRASELKPKLTLDLYCGTGPVGLHLARVSERVLGMESVDASVQAARRNAVRNQITNIEFLSVAVEKAGETMQALSPDLVVVDPPRAGLHPKAMKLLRQQAAPHIFYISCNPATLARDLKLLCEDGYRVELLQPVDMFPHTFHVEALATLRRR